MSHSTTFASASAASASVPTMNAFVMKLVSSLSAIVPFWASNILRFLQMGNEYNMIISLVLSHSLDMASASFDEKTWLACIGSFLLLSLLNQFGVFNFVSDLFKREPKPEPVVVYQILLYEGKEEHVLNFDPVLRYCEEIKAITAFVMKHHPGPHVLANRKSYLLPVNQLVIHEDEETGLVVYLTIKRCKAALITQAPIPTSKDEDGVCVFYGTDLHQFINRGNNNAQQQSNNSSSFSSSPSSGGGNNNNNNNKGNNNGGGGSNTGGNNTNSGGNNNDGADNESSNLLKNQLYVQYILSATDNKYLEQQKLRRKVTGEQVFLSNTEIKKGLEAFLESVLEEFRADLEIQKLFATARAGIQVPPDCQHVVLSSGTSLDGAAITAIVQRIINNNPYLAVNCAVALPGETGYGYNRYPGVDDEEGYRGRSSAGGSGSSGASNSAAPSTLKENNWFYRLATETKIKFTMRLEEGLDSEFILDDDVRVHLVKQDYTVNFHLIGQRPDVDCRQWIVRLLLNYSQENQAIFQYSYTISGVVALFFSNGEGLTGYRFPPLMWAICWFVASKRNLENEAKMIAVAPENKRMQSKYSYEMMIPDGVFLEIMPELFLVSSSSAGKGGNNNGGYYSSLADEQQMIKYSLFSNTIDLHKFTENLRKEYEEFTKNQLIEVVTQRRNLYFLRYKGLRNGRPDFSHSYIHTPTDKDGKPKNDRKTKLGVSFDNVFHEHVDRIKRDLERLDDEEYFISRGLQQKVIYLFSGEPGTGKTVTIRCMAELTGRSIVYIPCSILTQIHEISDIIQDDDLFHLGLNQSNCIFVFDEIDVGMESVWTPSGDNNNEPPAKIIEITSSSSSATASEGGAQKDPDNVTTINKAKINVSSFLTSFDGLDLYDKFIAVLATNHADRLPPALMREMRCSPIEFKRLRRIDAVKTIFLYFKKPEEDYDAALEENIEERLWVPSKLVSFCQIYSDEVSVVEFLTKVIPSEQEKIKEEDARKKAAGKQDFFH